MVLALKVARELSRCLQDEPFRTTTIHTSRFVNDWGPVWWSLRRKLCDQYHRKRRREIHQLLRELNVSALDRSGTMVYSFRQCLCCPFLEDIATKDRDVSIKIRRRRIKSDRNINCVYLSKPSYGRRPFSISSIYQAFLPVHCTLEPCHSIR